MDRVEHFCYKDDEESCLSEFRKVELLMERHGFNHKSIRQQLLAREYVKKFESYAQKSDEWKTYDIFSAVDL